RLAARNGACPERHPVRADRAGSAGVRLVEEPASVGRVAHVQARARAAGDERGSDGRGEQNAHRVHVYVADSSSSPFSCSSAVAAFFFAWTPPVMLREPNDYPLLRPDSAGARGAEAPRRAAHRTRPAVAADPGRDRTSHQAAPAELTGAVARGPKRSARSHFG